MGLNQMYRFGLIGNTSLRQFKKKKMTKTSFVLTPINVEIDLDVRVQKITHILYYY